MTFAHVHGYLQDTPRAARPAAQGVGGDPQRSYEGQRHVRGVVLHLMETAPSQMDATDVGNLPVTELAVRTANVSPLKPGSV